MLRLRCAQKRTETQLDAYYSTALSPGQRRGSRRNAFPCVNRSRADFSGGQSFTASRHLLRRRRLWYNKANNA